MIDEGNLEKAYKNHPSGFRTWDQLDHASGWMLLERNRGQRLSIDETSLRDDLFTILSNKEGHEKQGCIVAMVRGTKASDVIKILMQISQYQRLAVTEVTMDFSESMAAIVRTVFPNATIVIDYFHIIKRRGEAVDEIRLRCKRQVVREQKKTKADFKKKIEQRVKTRKAYRKKHPKTYKGKKRGRKPMRLNERYIPEMLCNGDTHVELLARSRFLLMKSRDEWSESQKKRGELLFKLYPKIEEAFNLINSLRRVSRNKKLDKDSARKKLQEWHQKVSDSTLREVKSTRDTIRSRQDEVLNYFLNFSTNTAAESLNAKIKSFRSQLHGISDLPFFIYRLGCIFG